MRKIFTLCTVLAVTFFVLNGVITQASNQDSFWNEAAQSGMAEVMLSNLALQKSQNEQVRTFAQQMVTDHTAANSELTSLASTKNVTLPTDVDSKHRSAMDKLNGMSGTDFDKAYMKQMVKDHEAAVKLFQRQADRGDDADAKAFAAKTLPTLQGHLQMARNMNDSMKNMKSNDSNGNSNGNSNSSNSNSGNMNSNSSNMNMNSNSGNMNGMNMNSNSNSNRSNSNRNTNSNSNSNRNTNSNSNRNTNSNTNSNSNVNRR
jgi:putative membrane protein